MLGLVAMGGRMLRDDWGWVGTERTWLVAGISLLGMMVLVAYFVPTMMMIVRSGHNKLVRGIVLVVGFPVIAICITVGLTLMTLWAAGYVAMAVRSMML